ncbi:PE-PPE domain-containing protein [Gordonia sp. PKS22-38]|uniref:PE-PPE domain-containing protein n=1 Tax=Gordonia prachuapensis TaxID=3115651 RepID=A0ABU7MQ12_9ACTN|nr:PE-PPE domain-containing protein [Gordonia sp. PKS22-38]
MVARFRLTRRVPAVLIAISSCLTVVAAFCLPGSVGSARADECGGGAVIIVGGTNDPEAASMVGVGQRYTGHKPINVDGETVIVPDPSSPYYDDPGGVSPPKAYKVIRVYYPTTLWPLGALGYDQSVAAGEAATKKAIATYQQECAGNPIVVTGYSQGARVAGDVLSDIGNGRVGKIDIADTPDDSDDDVEIQRYLVDEQGNVVLDSNGKPIPSISGELYSDPRRDGTIDGEGVELALPGIFPGLTMSGARDGGFGDVPVTSVCVEGDGICDVPDPVHDPIGAIDALVGYFTKHGYYPYQMWLDPDASATGAGWANTTCTTAEGSSTTVCEVHQDSAIVGVIRDGANAIGLDGSTIPDFLEHRWTIDLPYGAKLSNLQPLVRLVQDHVPPLPELGYGGYLPDLFVFEDILDGIVNNAPDEVKGGVRALAASAKSIVLIPVNFVKYWAAELIGPRISERTTAPAEADTARQAVLLNALDDVGPPALVTDGATTGTTSSDDPKSGGAETDAAAGSATADSSAGSTSSVPAQTTTPDAATSAGPDFPGPDSTAPDSATSGEQTPKTPSTPPDTSAPSTPHAPDPSATDSDAGGSNGVAGGDVETDGAEDNDGDGNGEGQTTGPGLSTTGAGTGSSKDSSSSEAGDDPGSDE